ncbi:MAG TPA: chemotaxis protein CheW [Polyangia bacterium]|nr:chemotaxis protein CheW [Polyangia bacterium]
MSSAQAAAATLPPKHVCFLACGQEFAVPIAEVLETTPLRPLTRIFHTQPVIAGVMSLRGEIVAVLDLGVLLGLGPTDIASAVVLVRSGVKRAGFLAERLTEVRELAPTAIDKVPQSVPDSESVFLRGVVSLAHGPLLLLDLEQIFADERIRRYERRA